MIVVTMDKLHAAEPDRWPGYAAWVVEQVRAGGGQVLPDAVRVPAAVHAWIRAEVERRTLAVPLTPARVVAGAVKLARAAVGAGGASADLAATRLAVCAKCPQRKRDFGGQCGLCQCVLSAKVRDATERCPAGRWPDARQTTLA